MEIRIYPKREMFYSADSMFGIYAVEVHKDDVNKVQLNRYGNISLKGNMQRLTIDGEYFATVEMYEDSKWGNGYIAHAVRQDLPTDIGEQEEYIKQMVTEKQFESIMEIYKGQDILQLIRDNVFDYTKIKGMGEKVYNGIKNKLIGNEGIQELLAWLGKYGVKYNTIAKIVESFQSPELAKQMIEENPYLLAQHVNGIGFLKADEIALKIGVKKDSPHRIKSCIIHAIKEENQSGHSYVVMGELIEKCQDYLELPNSLITDNLMDETFKDVTIIGNRVTLTYIYMTEQYVSERLIELNEYRPPVEDLIEETESVEVEEVKEKIELEEIKPFDVEEFLNRYCTTNEITLTDEQRSFFFKFMEHNILFLVANAGSGKSFLQKILVAMLREMRLSFRLTAPTGKASKLLSSYVGYPASTLHRALGIFSADEFDIDSALTEDVFIVDECSMMDIFLAKKLLQAVSLGSKIVFIGDDFQLPSVQVGNFLYDCINSYALPVVRLTKVFRQSEGGVLDVATKIRKGEKFLDSLETGKKKFGKDMIIHLTEQDHMVDGYKFYYKELLKQFDKDDIIILSPTKKGLLGTKEVNKEIQKIINPKSDSKKEYTYGDIIFRVGDLVMNTSNAYGIETIEGFEVNLFNGEMGKVVDIDLKSKKVMIDFSDVGIIPTPVDYLKNIIHSYCVTIHKMQGSSYPVVLMLSDKAHKFQLNANLLYTGLTRTSKYAVMLSQAETINFGGKKFANMSRKSFLGEMLTELHSDMNEKELA